MWGKVTERNNRTQTKVISETTEPYRFLTMPGIKVFNVVFATDGVVWVSWNYAAEEHVPNLRHTNEVISAYVTALPRIHVYRYLDRLQENAIYCDTDSVIYIQPRDEPRRIETEDRIGDMTSELRPSEGIVEFVSWGPKNCVYRLLDTASGLSKTVCKFRGLTLKYSALQLVNFEAVKDMIFRMGESTVKVHTKRKIKRKKRVVGTVSIFT